MRVILASLALIIRRLIMASALAACSPSLAHGQDTYAWGMFDGYRSTVILQPTDAPGAVAEVVFDNKTVHSDEEVTFPLTMDGLTVTVIALVGRGLTPDHMTVEAPPGFYAVPVEIDVAEDEVGRVVIYPYLGF